MKDRILPILFILFFILPVQAKREPDLYKKQIPKEWSIG